MILYHPPENPKKPKKSTPPPIFSIKKDDFSQNPKNPYFYDLVLYQPLKSGFFYKKVPFFSIEMLLFTVLNFYRPLRPITNLP
jgi:hypothetical protein